MADLNQLGLPRGVFASVTGHPLANFDFKTPEDLRTAVANAVDKKRETLRGLMDDIARLQSIRNMVTPVNLLPHELLAMVFAYATADGDTCVQLIGITHVCHLWRHTALNSAALWTRIAVNDPLAIATFLERAKSLPVSLSVTLCRPPVVSTVRLIASETHRLRSLRVRVPAEIALEIVTNRLKVAAPMLEEFCIEKLDPKWGRWAAPDAADAERSLRTLDMPSLRSLSLRGVPLLYIPQGPNSLRELTLHRRIPPPDTLLQLLKDSPALEKLCVGGTFEFDTLLDREAVALRQLKSFHLSTFPPQGIANLLGSLVLPRDVKVAINAPLDIDHDFENIFVTFPPAPQTVGLACFRDLRRLELCWDVDTLDLRAYRGADDFTEPALHIAASHLGPYPGNCFLANWAFDTSQVETVVLCGNSWRERGVERAVARTLWAPMFDRLPALKTLRLMCIGQKTLEEFIASFLVGPNPHLETIEVVNARPGRVFWDRLHLMLTMRGSRRPEGSIKRVELYDVGEGPDWDPDYIAVIKVHKGVEVVWDLD
ncbi:hypothetical protein BN946_scf185004.g17 [Trametes cinnabarina]|uniref:Uncharacterized protein n=1 Tax=Pycnoporus cinnabarinus TaxID=5643 RepID=A0A060SK53_PYCCI|nr:hypothetical protein BN946_scf185004.g17 [Trametes cinnabarina]